MDVDVDIVSLVEELRGGMVEESDCLVLVNTRSALRRGWVRGLCSGSVRGRETLDIGIFSFLEML